MKKIPLLYERDYSVKKHPVFKSKKPIAGMGWVECGEGVATEKYDGACCAIIEGKLYKRYDAKKGKPVPNDAIPCQEEADAITGHFPCWVPCSKENPSDQYFYEGYELLKKESILEDGTYELIGPKVQGNPYGLKSHALVRHGMVIIDDLPHRDFDSIRDYLEKHYIEGIVFWLNGEPKCKIRRKDFGFSWNQRSKEGNV